MAILIDENTKVLIQGITGSFGARHASLSLEYGTKLVAGVTPGKGGQKFEDKVPIFDTVSQAVSETGATASAIFVPPPFAADAILEAADAGVDLIVAITEGIPVMDMMRVKSALQGSKSRLVGPNCPGLVTPGYGEKSHGGCRIGIAPGYIHKRGNVGVVSRSGTLTYEAVFQLTELGYGQSTCVGIGGDPIIGTTHIDCLAAFQDDPDTDAIVMIGEIGGDAEERAAAFIAENVTKPVVGYVAGFTAPEGKTMGHAGAIVSGSAGTAAAKQEALEAVGVKVGRTPSATARLMREIMGG
jgi:succinyl-CoA synthetase alpha subunit